MIELIVRGFVLMSSAWLIALVLRRKSAALRAGVWTVAFASLLAMPAIARVTPSWKIAVWPAIETATAAAPAPGAVAATLPNQVPETRALPAASEPERPVFQGRVQKSYVAPSQVAAATPADIAPVAAARPEVGGDRLESPVAPAGFKAGGAAIAFGLWAFVAVLLLARIVVNRIAAARLIARSASHCEGDAAWRADVEAARAELGITREIRIRFTDAVAVPAVIGIRRPALLLPLDAGRWTAEARRVVVLHELAHVARWDAFDQLVSEAGCALYWIVPPVWMAARSAAALREQATDDAVIRAGVRPSTYAAELIDLAQNIAGVETGAASLAMAGSRIQHRVAAILDPSARRGRVTITGALALILVAGLAVTTLAAISPERQVVVPPVPPAPPAPPVPPAPPAPAVPPAPPAYPAELPPYPMMAPPAPMAPMAPMAPLTPPVPPAPMAPMVPFPEPLAPPPVPMAPPAAPAPRAPIVPPAPMAPPALPVPGAATAPPAPLAPMPPLPHALPRGTHTTSSSGPERSTLCPAGRDSFSNQSNSDGSRQSWSVKISGRGCSVELKSEGKIEFNGDFTDVASISPSGYFRLTLIRNGNRQELDIDGRGSALTHTYRVDGSSHAYDAAAKSWFADFLIELDRETAIGVDIRLPKMLRQGGVDAVLKETAEITNDYARSRYYGKLSTSVKLSSAETVRVLNQAASMGTQDYYAADLVKSLGPQVGDSSSERAALLSLVANMHSDYYIAESANSIFTTRQVTPGDVDFLLKIMPRMQSDYYKHAVVRRIVESGRIDAAQRGALATVLTTMKEDYYMGAVLTELMRDGGPNDSGRQAIIGAVARIKGAYYASEAVRSVLRDSRMSDGDLLRMVDVVRPIHEDHYKSEALRAILNHANASARVRQAVLDASAGMSQYYRDQVRRAAGERVQ
jgi:beta-lactamase regulating signal transducer with metallopeptidase domain